MSGRIFGNSNPGLGGLKELTNAETSLIQSIASQSYVRGDILFYNGTSLARLPAGTPGYVLSTNGTSADPSWIVASSGAGTWGSITGTLSSQTDLQTALDAKATDSTVVHDTTDETIAGVKTFTDQIVVANGASGTPSLKVSDAGGLYRVGTGILGFVNSGGNVFAWDGISLYPLVTNTKDIGSTTLRWAKLWVTNIDAAGAISGASVAATGAITAGTTITATGAITGSNLSGTNTGNETTATIGALVSGATAIISPVDADMIPVMDSAASNIIKKFSWASAKARLKTYFDTLYSVVGHTHALTEITQSGATTNQVPQWNGTAWSPATLSTGGSVTAFDPIGSTSWFTQQLLHAALGTYSSLSGIIEWAPASADNLTYYLPSINGGTGGKLLMSNVKRVISRNRFRHTSGSSIIGFGFGSATNSTYLGTAVAGTRVCFTWTDFTNLYCVTSSGTGTPTATLVTGSPSITNWQDYLIDWDDEAASVKFYYNGTLVATHTTQIPNNGDECRWMIGSSASRSCAFSPAQVSIKIA